MSDKQGNVPQFSDYEKELLLDGGWQCSFSSLAGKRASRCGGYSSFAGDMPENSATKAKVARFLWEPVEY